MPLFKTTTDHGHWHLVFVSQAPTPSVTSMDGKDPHRHDIALPDPNNPGPFMLLPHEPPTGEPHSHGLLPEPIRVSLPGEPSPDDLPGIPAALPAKQNDETMAEIIELWRLAKETDDPCIEEADRAKAYLKSDQWCEEDRQELEDAGRPALTLNLIEPMCDLLSGYARQNRVDWRWFPVEASDSAASDLFNIVSKHLAKRTNLETEEIDVFDEGALGGRSFFEVIPEFKRNPLGEVRVRHFPSANVRALPHRKKDMSDCDGLFKFHDVSLADAKAMFPDYKDKFDALFLSEDPTPAPDETNATAKLVEDSDRYGATIGSTSLDPAEYRGTVVDIGAKTIRIGELERREYRPAHFLLIPGEMQAVEVDSKTAAKAQTLDPLVKIIDTQASRIRVTLFAGPYVIRDSYPLRPFNEFSLVPYYAKKDEDEFWGKVRAVFDCQDEVNKRHSQCMDILNKAASYGWFYDDDTFDAKKDAQYFDKVSSGPGFRCKVKSTNHLPVKVEGTKFPNEIFQMEQASMQMFHVISNVNVQAMGQAKAEESGFARQIQVRQAMIGNEFLFDNFIQAKRRAGRIAMAWAKIIYSAERVARIVLAGANRREAGEEPLKIGGQEVQQPGSPDERRQLVEALGTIWRQADLLDYDVEVGEGALSPTARQAVFSQWLEAAKTGVPVPPEILIDYSDLPRKDRYLRLMREQQERQMKMEEERTQAELLKARGGAPNPAADLATSNMVRRGDSQRPGVPPGPTPGPVQ